jgi:Transposase DDE domain
LANLFGQILQLCEKAGLVKLGHVALDGTKIKANASKHKAMSYERMEKRAAELEAEVAKWLSTAEAADAEEDKLHGLDQTGEEMPDWVADKKRRAERIRKAKVELEVEAKEAAEAKLRAEAKAEEKREAEGRKKPGRKAAPPSTEPDAKAQKNFTDPDSRHMKNKDGFVQAYNAQAAVDAEAQIIVAHDVTQSAVDCGQLVPMTDAIETNLGRKTEQLSADAGYCSEANLEALVNRNIDAYVATGRARDAVAGTVNGEVTAALSCRRPTRQRASRPCAPRSERPCQPLSTAQATARAGVRANQTGSRLPPVPAARHRESARRVGYRLHRPQSSEARTCEAGPEVESVRCVAADPCSTLTDGQRA